MLNKDLKNKKYNITYKMPINKTLYKCNICDNQKWDQKSHLESHMKTDKHKDKLKIKELELKSLSEEELKEKYNDDNVENILKKYKVPSSIYRKLAQLTDFIKDKDGLYKIVTEHPLIQKEWLNSYLNDKNKYTNLKNFYDERINYRQIINPSKFLIFNVIIETY